MSRINMVNKISNENSVCYSGSGHLLKIIFHLRIDCPTFVKRNLEIRSESLAVYTGYQSEATSYTIVIKPSSPERKYWSVFLEVQARAIPKNDLKGHLRVR